MGQAGAGQLMKSWRTLLEAGPVAAMTDAMLLERFAARRDAAGEAAFAALVARHGPMVRRLCRRWLVDPHDADDAFQATFLVLSRRAGSIRHPERLASWLYGTAHRTSRKLKAQSSSRRRHEAGAARVEPMPGDDPGRIEEVQIVLDEVARLPEAWRAALVLCELEGRPQAEAARSLGCSDRTLRRRLTRASGRLHARLTRRGLAPSAALLASAFAADPASAAVPATTADATAHAALEFAAGKLAAGTVPASAVLLAEGIITTMLSIKIKGIAVAAGVLLMLGVGAGVGLGFAHSPGSGRGKGPAQDGKGAVAANPEPSPAEQYRALVKRYDDAEKAYQKAAYGATPEETSKIWVRMAPDMGDLGTRFVALAERYPGDPAAVDALLWVVEKTTSGYDAWETPFSKMVGRAMEILARDHAGDPRLGPLCLELTGYGSPRRDKFLRAIAERSPDRVVKGRATLAFAEYLWMKAISVEMIQRPDAPENLEKIKALIVAFAGPEALAGINPPLTAAAANMHKQRKELEEHAPDYLKHLLAADPVAIRRESVQLYDRVSKEFGDVPDMRRDRRPTRETLADVARRETAPGWPAMPRVGARPLGVSFRSLDDAYQAAERSAEQISDKVGQNAAGVEAYKAAAPRWADYGRKMWKLAQENPRHPDAFEALLWLVGHPLFFDAYEERAAIVGMAVDALIRDHLDAIAADLAARNVAKAFNMGHPFPGPHLDRLYRALYERSPSREARGRMGLNLARLLKEEAELADSFSVRGTDPRSRPELAIWPPSFIARIRNGRPRRDPPRGRIDPRTGQGRVRGREIPQRHGADERHARHDRRPRAGRRPQPRNRPDCTRDRRAGRGWQTHEALGVPGEGGRARLRQPHAMRQLPAGLPAAARAGGPISQPAVRRPRDQQQRSARGPQGAEDEQGGHLALLVGSRPGRWPGPDHHALEHPRVFDVHRSRPRGRSASRTSTRST